MPETLADNVTRNDSRDAREKTGGGRCSALDPSTWVNSDGGDRREQFVRESSAFTKSIPRLSLPQFTGAPGEWPRWISLFKALVHDQASLSDVEKMTHLQQAVGGAAQQAIDGLLFDGGSYCQALIILHQRFGCEDDISQSYLNSMFSAPAPSIDNLASMEKFSTAITRDLRLRHSVAILRACPK